MVMDRSSAVLIVVFSDLYCFGKAWSHDKRGMVGLDSHVLSCCLLSMASITHAAVIFMGSGVWSQ